MLRLVVVYVVHSWLLHAFRSSPDTAHWLAAVLTRVDAALRRCLLLPRRPAADTGCATDGGDASSAAADGHRCLKQSSSSHQTTTTSRPPSTSSRIGVVAVRHGPAVCLCKLDKEEEDTDALSYQSSSAGYIIATSFYYRSACAHARARVRISGAPHWSTRCVDRRHDRPAARVRGRASE